MTFDKPYLTSSLALTLEAEAEAAAEERAALDAMKPRETLIDERLTEMERLAAADLVMKMRNVEQLAKSCSDAERARFADIFERTAKQFEAAALKLRRFRPDLDTPGYLREGSTAPLSARG